MRLAVYFSNLKSKQANGAAGFYRIRDVKQANKWNEKLKKYVKVQDARRPEIITVFFK
jgi:hypothetical protein